MARFWAELGSEKITISAKSRILRPALSLRRDWDSNPGYSRPYAAFRVRSIRPLWHLSKVSVDARPRIMSKSVANLRNFIESATLLGLFFRFLCRKALHLWRQEPVRYERNCVSRGKRNAPLPHYEGSEQTDAPHLR